MEGPIILEYSDLEDPASHLVNKWGKLYFYSGKFEEIVQDMRNEQIGFLPTADLLNLVGVIKANNMEDAFLMGIIRREFTIRSADIERSIGQYYELPESEQFYILNKNARRNKLEEILPDKLSIEKGLTLGKASDEFYSLFFEFTMGTYENPATLGIISDHSPEGKDVTIVGFTP